MNEEIVQLTEELLNYNRLFLHYFEEARLQTERKDFYQVVKPFADEVKKVMDDWSMYLLKWLKTSNSKHLNINQVTSTCGLIEQLSVQAFYPETSKSRFLNSQRAIEYFLSEVVKEVKKMDC